MKCPIHAVEMTGEGTALVCPGCANIARHVYPLGCVCPAGANLQCENPLCPRKGLPQSYTLSPTT